MNQKIDQQSLDSLISILTNAFVYMRPNRELNGFQTTVDNLTNLFGNLSPNEIHKIISNNTHNFYTHTSTSFKKSTTKHLLLLIIENAEQKNHNNNLSKQVAEMTEDIRTLNEKMAVLIDALSTIDQKN